MVKFKSILYEFGETVQARRPGDVEHKLSMQWELGIWLGFTYTSGEHIIATADGVLLCRSVRRLPREEQWTREKIQGLRFPPWATTLEEVKKFDVGEEWTPTPGCAGCERGHLGREHNATCKARRARRQMLFGSLQGAAAAAAPPMPAAAQAHSVPEARSSTDPAPRAAEASTASAPVVPPPGLASAAPPRDAPMDSPRGQRRPSTAEPPPSPIRRRLHEKTNPAMIAVVEACEEPEPELNGMQEMGNDNEEMEAAKEEFDRLELFDAFEVVDPSVLTTKPLDMIWVKEFRSGELKMRLCVRGFLKASGSKDSL